MLLDIVVTHYKEPWEVGKPLFDMLAIQRGIDLSLFRVLVINDGIENHIPDQNFAGYPYRVNQCDIEHGGVSKARNTGIDLATAEWINFCDFDDTYSNVYALRDIFNIIKNCNYDLLWTRMLTEDFTGMNGEGQQLYLTPEKRNFVFIHGKYYRRDWLVNSGIRFDTDFSFQEDSLFNALALAILPAERIGMIKTFIPPYIWCRRDRSVTNSQANADKATWGHFRRNWKICKFYKEHSHKMLEDMVVRSVYDAFFMITSKTDLSLEMRDQLVNAFKEFIGEFAPYYRKPDDDTLRQIQEISIEELMMRPVEYDFDTVTNWKKLFEGAIE